MLTACRARKRVSQRRATGRTISGVDPLLTALARWKPFTAVVVGDFMLDQLHFGDAERLSADAPVPVLHVKRCEDRPGGAANVCLDLVAMRGSVRAVGVTGIDPEGALLRKSLHREGVDERGLVDDAPRPTTVKRSLIGMAQARHLQKMFRVDFESREPLSREVEDALLESFDAQLRAGQGADVVCLEDYGKGVCTPRVCGEVIRRAAAAGVPVLVDPARAEDYSKYRSATAITPNRTEAELATGLATDGEARPGHNARLARALMEKLDVDAVVLTLDRHGALLLERGGEPLAVPTVAREVYDVTGAGDMMLAALAAARANGIGWPDAVRLANAAAGLEVEVFGVVPMSLEKIHHELLVRAGAGGKVRTLEQVLIQVAALRREGKRIVFTNGCFDILHAGHVALLEKAAAEGDFLVVGLNDDASVMNLKGPGRPVNNQEDRARVLGALAGVGAVVLFAEPTPLKLIEAIRPDVLVKGADYQEDQVVGGSLVKGYGGRVALIELVAGKSTTGTIARMRSPAKV
jgi:D-beta-D-heptose 7-phosphate kinase/D-beta-D-heptose 1-phosphate adenosyltransferase